MPIPVLTFPFPISQFLCFWRIEFLDIIPAFQFADGLGAGHGRKL